MLLLLNVFPGLKGTTLDLNLNKVLALITLKLFNEVFFTLLTFLRFSFKPCFPENFGLSACNRVVYICTLSQ